MFFGTILRRPFEPCVRLPSKRLPKKPSDTVGPVSENLVPSAKNLGRCTWTWTALLLGQSWSTPRSFPEWRLSIYGGCAFTPFSTSGHTSLVWPSRTPSNRYPGHGYTSLNACGFSQTQGEERSSDPPSPPGVFSWVFTRHRFRVSCLCPAPPVNTGDGRATALQRVRGLESGHPTCGTLIRVRRLNHAANNAAHRSSLRQPYSLPG